MPPKCLDNGGYPGKIQNVFEGLNFSTRLHGTSVFCPMTELYLLHYKNDAFDTYLQVINVLGRCPQHSATYSHETPT